MTTKRTRAELMRTKAWGDVVIRIESYGNGGYFSKENLAFFSSLFHGQPVTTPGTTDTYFVESQRNPFSDEDEQRRYIIKVVRGKRGNVEVDSLMPPSEGYLSEHEALRAMSFVAGVTPRN